MRHVHADCLYDPAQLLEEGEIVDDMDLASKIESVTSRFENYLEEPWLKHLERLFKTCESTTPHVSRA